MDTIREAVSAVQGEGRSQQGSMVGVGGWARSIDGDVAAGSVESKLDPSAKEWSPLFERAPEEDRCLYLTFSSGFPLTESQIQSFFTRKYGTCVERVYVHRPEAWRKPPLFGKIVFNASFIPALILNGQKQSKFVVDRRTLWCKKFEPKNSKINSIISKGRIN